MKKNELFEVTLANGSKRIIGDGRHTCVVGIIDYYDQENDMHWFLANKRGPGCPTCVGMWNMPCGYLDAGSGEENIAREVFEETGITIAPDLFVEIGHSDLAKSRNVTFRYLAQVDQLFTPADVKDLVGGETDEVSEIAWIPENKIEEYNWAFDQLDLIKYVLELLRDDYSY